MRRINFGFLAVVLAASPAIAAPTNSFSVTFEAPNVQSSTVVANLVGVESFDTRGTSTGQASPGEGPQSFSNVFSPALTVNYSNVFTLPAGANGGALGTGRYSRAPQDGSTTIDIVTPGDVGIDYFGMWISAFDSGNFVDFFRNDTLIFTFAPANVLAALGSCVGATNQANNGYCGNPNQGINGIGTVANEPYAFVNFRNTDGVFDKINIRQNSDVNAGAGYQTDNHTFAAINVPAVPEPATWAMLIGGFGLAGVSLRRKRRAVAA